MDQRRGKVLVIRGGAIGDFILTLPVLQALRQSFPGIHLEVLGYPHIARLAEAGGLVERVRPIEAGALAGFFANRGELNKDLANYFSQFALIISFLYDPDKVFETNVRRCSSAQFIVGPHRADDTGAMHATDAYLKPLEQLTIFDADRLPQLRFPKADDGPDRSVDWLAVHPGSGSERKNWPEEKWADLLSYLAEQTRFHLLLLGGEAEEGRLERLAAQLPAERYRIVQSRPLPEVGQSLQECAGFIGHDSGISHLAAAVGVPSLLLWGPARAEVWSPVSERVKLLQGEGGLNFLTVEEVVEGGKRLIGKL